MKYKSKYISFKKKKLVVEIFTSKKYCDIYLDYYLNIENEECETVRYRYFFESQKFELPNNINSFKQTIKKHENK